MANQKLTQEELQKFQEVQQKNAALVQELGQIGLAQLNLDKRQDNAEKYLDQLREEETAFVKELEDKYGQGSIDLEKGEFIPAPAQTTEPKFATGTESAE
jgi:hypothetical protein